MFSAAEAQKLRDEKKYEELYAYSKSGAAEDDPDALSFFGLCYFYGYGCVKDIDESNRLFA